MVKEKITRLFAGKVLPGDFDPEKLGFKRVKDTQVFRHIIKSSRSRPLKGKLSSEEIAEACSDIFNFLRHMADKKSPRKIYKSAGALIGRNGKGNIVVLVAVNAVPYLLAQKGIGGEAGFKGLERKDNATGHFEIHCQLAAGKTGVLHDAIMINCDFMCPHCANLTAVFGARVCLVDSDYMLRPIFQDRIMAGKTDHSKTTSKLLASAGVRILQHHPEQGLVDLNTPMDKKLSDIVKFETYFTGNVELRDNFLKTLPYRVQQYRPEAESAVAIVFKKKRGKFHVYFSASEVLENHEAYKGKNPGAFHPVGTALIRASAEGRNVSKAEIYCRGVIDVNEALHLVTANPEAIHLTEGFEKIPIGARKILEFSGIKLVLPPHLRPHARPQLALVG